LALSERLSDKSVQNVLKRLAESKEEDNNYLAFLFRKNSYLDASSAVNADGYKLYRITSNPILENMTNEHFNTLYNKLSYAERYHLIMNAMISKDLCHFVVNNKYILEEIMSENKDPKGHTFMNKYAQLIRYTLGYGWLTMYMEESIKRGYISKSDRFIFDIETASKLPFFPYSTNNIHICPYLPILVDSDTINADKNILGVCQYIYNNKYGSKVDNEYSLQKQMRYGVVNKKKFIERVNMFISGKTNTNILEGLNWSNIAMSGSMMACCLPNYNSLMNNFVKNINTNLKEDIFDFIGFANEYYKDADIDVMCNIQDIYEFVDKIYEIQSVIEENIRLYNRIPDGTPNVTTVFSNKSAAIMINKYFIKTYLQKETGLEYVDILSNVNSSIVRDAIYKHYINWYKEYLKTAIKQNPNKFIDNKYHELYLPVPIENINVVFIKTQKDKEEDRQEEQKKIDEQNKSSESTSDSYIDIEEDDKEFEQEKQYEDDIIEEYGTSNIVFEPKVNFKFRITSSYLPHNFELFQTKYTEFFNTVARFHLPIVRSYFDGDNVYITPSCVSACMTMLNIDYKYFAGSKDPIEIINKYRMRGFGTILNDREIIRLIEYSNLVPKWKQLYSLNIQSNSSVFKILGQLEPSHTIFKPSFVLDKKEPSDEYKKPRNMEYMSIPNNVSDIISLIRSMYFTSNVNDVINLTNITTINKYGYVEPVKKWLIDAFYDNNFNQMHR